MAYTPVFAPRFRRDYKGAVVDKANFLKQREDYYRMNGWDPVTGNPTEVKLRELGLDRAWEAMGNKA